jgi:hypothetical protein
MNKDTNINKETYPIIDKLFLGLVIVIGITLFLDVSNLYPSKMYNFSWFKNIANNKELVYILYGFLLSIIIFLNQRYYGKTQHEKYINDLDLLKAVERDTRASKKLALDWFDDETEALLFYFPNTLIPGFWNDFGKFFDEQLKEKFENLTDDKRKDIFVIGPSENNSSQLEHILNKIKESDEAKKILLDEPWKRKFNNLTDIDEILSDLKLNYKLKINNFSTLIKRKEFVQLQPIDDIGYWKGKPNFSFVLKKNKYREYELLIIDTFNVIKVPSNTIKVVKSLNHIDSDNVSALFSEPINYVIKNKDALELFLSSLFQTAFKEEERIVELFLN